MGFHHDRSKIINGDDGLTENDLFSFLTTISFLLKRVFNDGERSNLISGRNAAS